MNREGERGERETERHRDRQTERVSRQMDIRTDRQRGTDGDREDTEKENRQENPSNVFLAHTHSFLKPEEFEENYIFGQCLEKNGNFKTIVNRKSADGGEGLIKTIGVNFIYMFFFFFLTEECSNCASY